MVSEEIAVVTPNDYYLRLSKCDYFEFSDFIFQLNIKDFCVFSGWYLKKLVLPHP